MNKIIRANRIYLTAAFLFLIIGYAYLLLNSRAESFRRLTPYHSNILDHFFTYFTYVGDGIFALAISLVLFIRRRFDFAAQVLLAFLLSGLVAQVFKYFIHSPRPKDFFGVTGNLYIIPDVTLGGSASFPSGHSTSVFALATSLALFSANKNTGLLYLAGAIAVGYSRVYLSQHFPVDVIAGATIGILTSVFVYWMVLRYLEQLNNKRSQSLK